jgi:hypothetical protein
MQVVPPKDVASTVQERAWTSPIWYAPSAQASKSAQRGMTVADLKAQGAKALGNAELQSYVVGKTLKVRNTVTGQTFEIAYGTDGQRLIVSVDGKAPSSGEYLNMMHDGQFGVPAKYEIKDGHLVTTLGGSPFEVTVFEANGKFVASRSNEFGYANYEIEAVKQ